MDRFSELLRDDDGAIADAAVRAARVHSPPVAALPEDEVRRHVRAVVRAAIGAITAGGELAEADLRAAGRLGADRARQGVPVAALLDGFQAGRALIVRTLVERGRAAGLPADDLLEGMIRIDAVATALEHRMVHAHRIAEMEMARTTRDAHAQVLRRVLHGEGGDLAPLDAARPYHCLTGDVADPRTAASLERRLTGGLCGLVDGRLAALVPRLPDLPAGTPLLVASPAVPLADIPSMYALCRAALRAVEGEQGLHRLPDLALAVATSGAPDLGRLLADGLLDGLDPADDFHRQLAETALAYLDNDKRIEPTAGALHVHPNTVKYRVRRFGDITGRCLAPPTGAAVAHSAHWWWALRTWLAR
ncbi:helix-turn-helix domain-containing protein [Actinoallomurus rhizosphaericola]|uniref:helix-turn-helix domain-containing protein n=1 Tax=Actinoallomurus rhizosphaericola TaxID=2952536 RepID=UPI0020932BD1|nr:helix-turn-helix domain-containing protein [Actinoallomurus rhizosphaericola]MCO5998374.1 helix-turn-helix domain-containing protein [Actinoallomurus rhizosphaericola]